MVDRPSRLRRRPALGAYRVVVAVYLAGLVAWLVLGTLPSLAGPGAPWHGGVVALAEGDGPLASYARRAAVPQMAPDPVLLVAAAYLFSLLNLALGVLLVLKRPRDLVPGLLALAFMGTSATFNEPSHAVFHVLGEPPAIQVFHFAFHVVSGTAYLLAVVLFPGGRLPLAGGAGRRTRRLLAGALTATVVVVCWRSSFIAHPPFFVVFFGVLVPVVGIAAQSLHLRERRELRSDEQSRLLRAALVPALAVALTWVAGHGAALVGVGGDSGLRLAAAVDEVFPAVFAVVPVVLFVSIVRHHLWDIDVVVSRALLVASLLALLSVLYVVVVAGSGLLLRGSGWAMLVPLVVVACVAEPLRERCQALCNRLVFGQRLSPREAVRSLVDRFAGIGDVDELSELTRVVVDGTRASRAEIWLVTPDGLVLLARHPEDPGSAARVPLRGPTAESCREQLLPARTWLVTYEGALLAVIAVATPRGTSVTATESRLLDDLSHHAGLLVRNAQLTVELEHELDVVSARAAELAASRRAVVLAQDRQRRRLERDIHDGAQQQLVALLIMLRGLARRPGARVADLRAVLEDTRRELTRLAGGDAPRVLVESGLVAGLEAAAAATRGLGPAVEVSLAGPWPSSPEADTAVYFCCLEALQNAVKHAGARHVGIRLASDSETLAFTVTDDGAGFGASGAGPGAAGEAFGSGLDNLRARLAPLGGRVDVESAPGAGTTVRGELPAPVRAGLAPAAGSLAGAPAP